jgi:rhodanese-related sulfurtransferase
MTAVLTPLSPRDVAARLQSGRAVLVDIREPDEFAREHLPGAVSAPLSTFEQAHIGIEPGRDVVFMCRTGARTGAHCDRLAARIDGSAFVLDGGLNGWKAAGMPIALDRKAPLELMRQVQIAAGSLVLLGALLAWLVHPAFVALSGFVGAGLLFAGVSGFCGMARMLAVMPWNQPRAA